MKIERDPSPAKAMALEHARQQRTFIEAQGASIKDGLDSVGLSDIFVRKGTEIRDGHFFDKRLTLGYVTPHHPSSLTVLASSEKSENVSLLFITPTKETSGLLTDQTNARLYTDSFWINEKTPKDKKSTLKHIKPSYPIPLDGIILHTDDKNLDPALANHQTETEKKFADTVYSKLSTKDTLKSEGLAVPDGTAITSESRHGHISKYFNFSRYLPDDAEIVIKPDKGTKSENIIMGNPRDPIFAMNALTFLENMNKAGKDMVLERRIIPPPQPALAERYNAELSNIDPNGEKFPKATADDMDYYFRILVRPTKEDPEIVGDFVRFVKKFNKPASAAPEVLVDRMEILDDPTMIHASYDAAKASVSAIYRNVYHDGDPDEFSGWVGVDIVPQTRERMHTLELEFFPAGYDTLAKIEGQPLAEVSEKLLPAHTSLLQPLFEQRQEPDLAHLRRVDLTTEQKISQYHANFRGGNFELATNNLIEIVQGEENLARHGGDPLQDFALLAGHTGDYTALYEYTHRLVEAYPFFYPYRQALAAVKEKMAEQK